MPVYRIIIHNEYDSIGWGTHVRFGIWNSSVNRNLAPAQSAVNLRRGSKRNFRFNGGAAPWLLRTQTCHSVGARVPVY